QTASFSTTRVILDPNFQRRAPRSSFAFQRKRLLDKTNDSNIQL
ncbi:hypothetical protein BN1723_002428, partial [Verticillium longisporum]